MIDYFYEHTVREQFRKLAALDQELTCWRWFQRNEYRTLKRGWRVRIGQGLIRVGCWLQKWGSTQPTRTSGHL